MNALVTIIDQKITLSQDDSTAHKEEGNIESLRTIRQILLDIDRTFPNHYLFTTGSETQLKLFYILTAYSHFDKTIGYCQGMAYIGALLLMYIHNEENAFWSFVYLLNSKEHLYMFYDKSLKKVRVLCEALDLLIEKRIPMLAKHMKEQGLHVLMYGTQWIMCLFTSLNCWESVLMIVDLFFTEGVHHLLNAGVALMELCKDELMAMSSLGEILPFLQNIPSRLVHRKQLKPLLLSHPVLANISKLEAIMSTAKERVEKEETTLEEENRGVKRRQKRQRSPELSDTKENSSTTNTTLFDKLVNVFTPANKRVKTDLHQSVLTSTNKPTITTPAVKSLKKAAQFTYTPDCGMIYTSPNTIEMKAITNEGRQPSLCNQKDNTRLEEIKRLSFDTSSPPALSTRYNNASLIDSPLLAHVSPSNTVMRRSPRIAKRRRGTAMNIKEQHHKYLISSDNVSPL